MIDIFICNENCDLERDGIHLINPSEVEFKQAIRKAHAEDFNAIIIHLETGATNSFFVIDHTLIKQLLRYAMDGKDYNFHVLDSAKTNPRTHRSGSSRKNPSSAFFAAVSESCNDHWDRIDKNHLRLWCKNWEQANNVEKILMPFKARVLEIKPDAMSGKIMVKVLEPRLNGAKKNPSPRYRTEVKALRILERFIEKETSNSNPKKKVALKVVQKIIEDLRN